MKRRNYKFLIRKAHRYLGIFIGVQFLFWTLGGLYFSWTNIEQVRGDDLRKEEMMAISASDLSSPASAISEIRKSDPSAHVVKLQIIEVLGESFYEVSVHRANGQMNRVLARTADGTIRQAITSDEAKQIAVAGLKSPPPVRGLLYLTADMIGADHEYREKPMPVWAIEFEGGPTVYVAADNGQIGAIRGTRWRIFDFLWMLHTLDFKARDDINNWLLRTMSVLGIVTICSGFALFITSSKLFRKRRKNG